MKRLIIACCAALMAIGAVAGTAEKNFRFEISHITGVSARVITLPSDTKRHYINSYMDVTSYDAETEQSIIETFKKYNDTYLAIYTQLTYASPEFSTVGNDTTVIKDLEYDTEYVVLAYYIETENGEATSGIDTAHFTTRKYGELDTVRVHIQEPKLVDRVEKSGWWQLTGCEGHDSIYYLSLSPAKCSSIEGNYTLADMEPNYTYFFDTNKDKFQLTFSALQVAITRESGNYILKAEGEVKGIGYYIFTCDPIPAGAEGVENVYDNHNDNIVKSLENGQLVIRRGEKRYSATGAEL